jgi:hypothetical protein
MKCNTECLVVIILRTHGVSGFREVSDVSENPRQCNIAMDCGENPKKKNSVAFIPQANYTDRAT